MQPGHDHPRVVMVSDVYFPRVNGVSTSIETFRRGLAELGCGTWLIAPEYPNPGGSGIGLPPGRHSLQQRRPEPGILRVGSRYLPFDPEDRVMVRRHFRRIAETLADRIDIVHVQTPFLAHYWGAALARRAGAKLVVSYHTYFEHYLHHYVPLIPRSVLGRFARAVSRSQLNGVDQVIAPSAEMAEALIGYGVEQPIEVLPTGLDLESLNGGDGARFRSMHGIAPKRPVLLTVGRVAHEKNLGFLVGVLERIRRERPDVLWVVAGEGPALESLKRDVARRGLRENARFVGYLDRRSELPDCYRGADLFVFASRTETQGLVLLEAMALGLPVVSTAVMGTKTVLADSPGAVVVDEDREAFAGAAAGLLADAGRRAVLGAAAARDAAERWSGLGRARKLLTLYARIAGLEDPAARRASDPRSQVLVVQGLSVQSQSDKQPGNPSILGVSKGTSRGP